MKNYETSIRILKEFHLNYKNQYPKEVPDMELIIDIMVHEVYLNTGRLKGGKNEN